MIKNIIFLGGLMIMGCESSQNEFQVNIHGELRKIMHGGAREGLVLLSDVIKEKHVYGVGALEGLDGEILIWDSKPILTKAKKGGEASHSMDANSEKALLLVSAKIKEWSETSFNGTTIESSLNDYIYNTAKSKGLNPDEPFPFILESVFPLVKWHIISDPGLGGTHDDHMNKSWNQTDKNRIGKILGFYSIKHHAIFTHHSTNSHMHYLDGKSGLSGHVDDLVLGENVILRLPK